MSASPDAKEKHADKAVRAPIEKKAYLQIGLKFGTVSKQAVTEAIKACRDKRDGDWLLIMGFAFESGITELSRSFGNFQVSIVRMHDDLLQLGLLRKDKKAASFVTIGEPDIKLHKKGDEATVEIAGLDIYDSIKDEVESCDRQLRRLKLRHTPGLLLRWRQRRVRRMEKGLERHRQSRHEKESRANLESGN